MKRFYVLLPFIILLFSIGCSKSDDSSGPLSSNNNRTMSFNGAIAVEIDTIQGQFNTDYDASPTIWADFVATNYSSGQSLRLSLYDEDQNSFPFSNNGVFPINSDPIRATARYTTFEGTNIQATSGSVTVNEFRRIEEPSRTLIEISGIFDFTDGSESVDGTFDNIQLICLECE